MGLCESPETVRIYLQQLPNRRWVEVGGGEGHTAMSLPFAEAAGGSHFSVRFTSLRRGMAPEPRNEGEKVLKKRGIVD